MKYTSKIGIELVLPILIILGSIASLFLFKKAWVGFSIMLAVIVFVGYIFANTFYTITKKTLTIQAGFFNYPAIEIESIKKIEDTNSPISAPATSLKRILITYNKYDSIIISPQNKVAFIQHLKNINPNIIVNCK